MSWQDALHSELYGEIEEDIEEEVVEDNKLQDIIDDEEIDIDMFDLEGGDNVSGDYDEGIFPDTDEEDLFEEDEFIDENTPLLDETEQPNIFGENIPESEVTPNFEINEITGELEEIDYEANLYGELGTAADETTSLLSPMIEEGADLAVTEGASIAARFGLEGAAAAVGEVAGAVAAVASPVLAVAGAVLAVKGVVDMVDAYYARIEHIKDMKNSILDTSNRIKKNLDKVINDYNLNQKKRVRSEMLYRQYVVNWENPDMNTMMSPNYAPDMMEKIYDEAGHGDVRNFVFKYKSDFPDYPKQLTEEYNNATFWNSINMSPEDKFKKKHPQMWHDYITKRNEMAGIVARNLTKSSTESIALYKILSDYNQTNDKYLKEVYDRINLSNQFQSFVKKQHDPISTVLETPNPMMIGHFQEQVESDPDYKKALASRRLTDKEKNPFWAKIPFWAKYYSLNKKKYKRQDAISVGRSRLAYKKREFKPVSRIPENNPFHKKKPRRRRHTHKDTPKDKKRTRRRRHFRRNILMLEGDNEIKEQEDLSHTKENTFDREYSYEPDIALEMCRLCREAYNPRQEQESDEKYDEVVFMGDDSGFAATQGRMYWRASDNTIIIVYRGTDFSRFASGAMDFSYTSLIEGIKMLVADVGDYGINLNNLLYNRGLDVETYKDVKVNAGFLHHFQATLTQVINFIHSKKTGEEINIYTAGHSLGAIPSVLLSLYLNEDFGSPNATINYNFGSPRGFARESISVLNSKVPHSFRIADVNDVIAALPGGLETIFCHFGECHALKTEGDNLVETWYKSTDYDTSDALFHFTTHMINSNHFMDTYYSKMERLLHSRPDHSMRSEAEMIENGLVDHETNIRVHKDAHQNVLISDNHHYRHTGRHYNNKRVYEQVGAEHLEFIPNFHKSHGMLMTPIPSSLEDAILGVYFYEKNDFPAAGAFKGFAVF